MRVRFFDHWNWVCSLLLVTLNGAEALIIRGYDPDAQTPFARSWGVPFQAVENGSFPHDASKFRDIMWPAHDPAVAVGDQQWHRQLALVSPLHFVTATHYPIPVGWKMNYFDSAGNVQQRTMLALEPILNAAGQSTDLSIGTLSSPVEGHGFPVLNLPNQSDYIGKPLLVFGTVSLAGTGTIHGFGAPSEPKLSHTVCAYFNYLEDGSGDSDCKFNSGDSGSPSFVMEAGRPALIGIHTDAATSGNKTINYDTFIPAYLEQLDTVMAASGYNIRRFHAEPASLSVSSLTTSVPLRHQKPATISIPVQNTGKGIARNLNVRIKCSNPPDSISGNGWVCEKKTSGEWICRRGQLGRGEVSPLTLNWRSLPDAAKLAIQTSLSHDASSLPSERDDLFAIASE
jgi:hypothetical protein